MREKKKFFLMTFQTTTQAMKLEVIAKEQGLPGRMIPIPASVRAGCGMAWRTEVSDREQILEAAAQSGASWEQETEVWLWERV